MKSLALVLTSILLTCSNAFAAKAITLTNEDSVQLVKSLTDAGAKFKILVDAGFMTITDLKCTSGGGIVYLPMHCQFKDEVQGQEIEVGVGQDSNEIVNALTTAGLKVVPFVAGELHQYSIGARSVKCSDTMVPQFKSCTIVK